MFGRYSNYLRELAASGVAIAVWAAAGSFWSGAAAGLGAWLLARGLVHVPDNSVRPLFLMGNYWKCIEPGYHVVFWPFVSHGYPIDTRFSPASSDLHDAFSTDRVPFSTSMTFPYRFLPMRLSARQRVAELIARGDDGRLRIVQEVARSATLHVLRQFSHSQLLTGPQQAQIQERVAQEAGRRLEPFGIEIQAAGLRLIIQGPKVLEAAFIQQQAALPTVQGLVTNMLEILKVINQYSHPDIQRYLDLHMTQVMGNQGTDPFTTLLAREWFRQRSSQGAHP